MAKERLSMRKIREVLRLKFDCGFSNRKIAKSCSIARSTVATYLSMAKRVGLQWPVPDNLSDREIYNLVFKNRDNKPLNKRQMPSMEYIHNELKKKSVTLQLLWYEYKQNDPDGYQFSYFCELYQKWAKKLDISLRQRHRAGEKLFIDYAGQTVPIHDPETGKVTQAQIFIAILGASNYTFVEATLSQSLPHWIKSHIHAFEFFGGVPHILVPDNLKSGITHPSRYEPDINPTYQDMALHYGTAVIPARSRKPRDKAKVENAVLVAERWILAALRNHTFFSLAEPNKAISQKLTELNDRKFQKLDTTRREMFENIDKPALKPLPAAKYEYAEWKKARVNIDYHIEFDRHYYSVPCQLRKEQVDVRFTDTTVEILFRNKRVASYPRSYKQGAFTTCREHMPKSHQQYLEWTPSRIIKWAASNGPRTAQLVMAIINSRHHPEQGFRACLGIMRLGKRYSQERLENACARALAIRSYSYKSIDSILKKGLDKVPLPYEQIKTKSIDHPNIRGNQYYG
ncbi:MAG: IS21 family transposase [Desulfobacteraceae bacterium]|nr:IS21 family transposase [Desulfobacteraceae bacterium]MBU4126040.1 IS21 family transposase [Pseudomonadota bacterium]